MRLSVVASPSKEALAGFSPDDSLDMVIAVIKQWNDLTPAQQAAWELSAEREQARRDGQRALARKRRAYKRGR